MGRIGRVLAFIRTVRHKINLTDVQVDPGGGPNITAEHFSAPGDDSYPLPGDYVGLTDQPGTGRESVLGYLDPKNEQKADVGEKRIYGRDTDGNQVNEFWLKNTGEIVITNGPGLITMQVNGDVVINGARIDAATGDVVTAAGKSGTHHTHAQGNDSDGSTEVETEKPS